MQKPKLLKECIWLIETIDRAKKITLAEINDKWKRNEDSEGRDLCRTTFNRHRDAILEMFGLIIDCDLKDEYRYHIVNREVLEENSIQNWLFSTLSVRNMINSNMNLKNRILLESIPSCDLHLQQIIKAMSYNRMITMTYRRYGADHSKSFSAAPYCVKLFRRRWYVLVLFNKLYREDGKESYKETLSIYGLDRIENIEIQDIEFTIDPDFDPESFFDECFGVVVGDGSKPVRMILRAYGNEQYYMRDLPIHHSQKEICHTDVYTDFELYVRPTSDFLGYLLSRGEWLQVISPGRIRDDIIKLHKDSIDKYMGLKNQG